MSKVKKYTYSPVRLSIFTVILAAWIIFGSIWYNNENKKETWLVCTLKANTDNYKETIKFRYVEDELYGYYEEEEISYTSESKEELEKGLQDFKDNMTTGQYVKYETEDTGSSYKINFYIAVHKLPSFFESYFSDVEFKANYSVDDFKNSLSEYDCKVTKK